MRNAAIPVLFGIITAGMFYPVSLLLPVIVISRERRDVQILVTVHGAEQVNR